MTTKHIPVLNHGLEGTTSLGNSPETQSQLSTPISDWYPQGAQYPSLFPVSNTSLPRSGWTAWQNQIQIPLDKIDFIEVKAAAVEPASYLCEGAWKPFYEIPTEDTTQWSWRWSSDFQVFRQQTFSVPALRPPTWARLLHAQAPKQLR